MGVGDDAVLLKIKRVGPPEAVGLPAVGRLSGAVAGVFADQTFVGIDVEGDKGDRHPLGASPPKAPFRVAARSYVFFVLSMCSPDPFMVLQKQKRILKPDNISWSVPLPEQRVMGSTVRVGADCGAWRFRN